MMLEERFRKGWTLLGTKKKKYSVPFLSQKKRSHKSVFRSKYVQCHTQSTLAR
jgi:hypothetical protein